jgi:peptidoglycan/LPS O-acetylase OafA/YrhL
MAERSVGGARNLGLDLIRALAITLVLIAHEGGAISFWFGYTLPHPLVATGFFGVELFFALSGFLIGGLLLDIIERDPSLAAWGRFMARRWLRTLPLYALWLAVLAIWWRPDGSRLLYLAMYGTLTQNFFWPMPADNWFGVSWSLSIEEWFYLLFSALLLGCVALTARRRLSLWCVIALFIVVPTALRWMVPDGLDFPEHIRRVVLLRLDAIAYGVAIVALWRAGHWSVARPYVLLAIGVTLLLMDWDYSFVWQADGGRWMRVFEVTVVPLAFSLCLPAAVLIRRLPGFEWLVRRLSALAYALYIVHLSVIDAVNVHRWAWGLSPVACMILTAMLIFGLAALLHRRIELPVMVHRPRQWPVSRAGAKQSVLIGSS